MSEYIASQPYITDEFGTKSFDQNLYPNLSKYASFMKPPSRPIVGREREMKRLLASLNRAELANAFLLGDAGSGKTMLVQGTSVRDKDRIYVEVDLAKMAASENGEDGATQMASRIKGLFDDAIRYKDAMSIEFERKIQEYNSKEVEGRPKIKPKKVELVMFIDEFHLLVQLSTAAAQAIKPILAESGRLGIRIIAATTFDEFHEFVEKDQALMQRLQRINVREAGKETVVAILESIAKAHDVYDKIYDNQLFELIYEYSNRYIPADSQPRKSILLLDSMIGWYRTYPNEFEMNRKLLADVIYDSAGVQVTFKVDGTKIEKALNERVFAQTFATKAIEQRLQIAVADLHDKTRPISSFLFSGPTGVGKALWDEEVIPVHDTTGRTRYKKNKDLRVGDYVYNREGKPVKILGVFPQGEKQAYRVNLGDGRSLICNDEHLFTWTNRHGYGKGVWKTDTLRTLMDKGISRKTTKGYTEMKFDIPMGGPVEYAPYDDDHVDAYAMGALIGAGNFSEPAVSLEHDNEQVVSSVAGLMKCVSYINVGIHKFKWQFERTVQGRMSVKSALYYAPELRDIPLEERFVPEYYKGGTVAQRWSLLKGLFDVSGEISKDGRGDVKFKTHSKQLIDDVREMLFSLGITSTIHVYHQTSLTGEWTFYKLHVKSSLRNKKELFAEHTDIGILTDLMSSSEDPDANMPTTVGIFEVEDLHKTLPMTCIQVDDPEHLYQAGRGYIVTHNTEMVKGMAALLFGDERAMIRFDMSEYALESSLDRFREELTHQVWNKSHSIILFDEVEKANPVITRLMLQVLDDGRLSNAQGREVSFLNTYIVLTTNAGSEIYESIAHYSQDDDGAGGMAEYQKVIRKSLIANESFAPEIINRMNAIIPFQPLTHKTYERILLSKLKKLQQEVLSVHGVRVMIHRDVVSYLVYEAYDVDTNSGGARGLIARMDSEVVSPLARYINKHPDVDAIGVYVNGEMAFRNKDMRESDAFVQVGTIDTKKMRR